MITKVLKTIEAYQMLSPDSAVVAGVSGGADSMALLHVLQSRRKDWPELKVTAAHVNHCLRGAEADRDEEHVRRYCQREGIPLEVLKIDVREEAAKRKLGLEACGRAVRYEFFRRLAGENGVIATAHTLSDLAETVLLHLTRGTGLKGLCGIPPVRENIVRPLIDCSRREIEDYCREHKIPYVTDSTNLEARYSRNKVRLQVLPALKEINPAFEEAVGRMAQSLREDDGCLCEEARELLGRAALEKGGWSCSVLSRGRKPVRIRAIRLLQGASRPEARHLEEIDRINIIRARLLAMERAIQGLSRRPDLALVDGNRSEGITVPCRTVVKGDRKSASIAAASILAKVSRDRYMGEMAAVYPVYGFERHKGYPTQLHYQRLRQYGPCPIHRRTFLKKL